MAKGKGYSKESVERALQIHADKGRIGSWILDPDKPGDRYIVFLNSGVHLELRSLREAYVFVNGLASAAQTQD